MKYDHLLNIELIVDHVIEYAVWCAQIALKSVRIISVADVVLLRMKFGFLNLQFFSLFENNLG